MKWEGLGWRGSMAEKSAQTVYVLGDVVFLPNYHSAGLFVSPGGLVWTTKQVQETGATESFRMLWTRSYNQGE